MSVAGDRDKTPQSLDGPSGRIQIENETVSLSDGGGGRHVLAQWSLGILLLVVCIVLTLSNASLQHFTFSSDQLTVPSFVEDILRNPHFTPFVWVVPPASYAFPDLPAFLIVRLLTGDGYVAAWVYEIVHVIAVALAAALFFFRAFPSRNQGRTATLAFLSLSAITLALATALPNGGILYQPFVSIVHATAAVCALVMFCAYEAILESRALWKHILVTTVCGLLIFSDRFFLIFFGGSYAIALILAGLPKLPWRTLGIFIAEMVAASVIAVLIFSFFVQQPHQTIDFNVIGRIAAVAQVILKFGVWPWLWLLAGAFAALILAWRAGPLRPAKVMLSASSRQPRIFVAALTGLGLVTGVMLWEHPHSGYQRYLVGLEFGALLSAAMLTADVLLSRLSPRNAAVLLIFPVILATAAANPVSPLQPLTERREIVDAMNACRKRFHLETGYADYWVARRISMATAWQIQVNQFIPGNPRLFSWGSDLLWFYYDYLTGEPSRANFIIDTSLKRPDIEKLYGKPSHEGDCGPFHVLVYEDGVTLRKKALETLVGQVPMDRLAAYLPNDFANIIDPFGRMAPLNQKAIAFAYMFRQIGSIVDGAAIASSTDHAGYLLYGPYISLSAGSYAVEFTFVCTDNATANVFDATANAGRITLASLRLDPSDPRCDAKEQTITLPFVLNKRTDAIEFRTFFGGSGTLRVTGMTLTLRRGVTN